MEPLEGARAFIIEKHQTLEEATYQHLRKAIIAGELDPGTRLVGSRLAAELHVSRLTVANALKRLTSEGYVVGRPHREAVVAALDEADLREIFLIRHTLEQVVMREVVKHVTPLILLRLQELNEQLRLSVEQQDIAAHRQIERDYHLLIYTVSGLPMMTDLLIDLWDRLEPYRGRRFSNLGLRDTAYIEHLAIHRALEARDEAQLVEAMHSHVYQGFERSMQTLTGDFSEQTSMKTPPVDRSRKEREQAPPGSLRAALALLPDQRRGQGKMHAQSSILALAVCAMLCGVRSRYGVAQWGQHCHPIIRSMLGLAYNQGPSIATIHRVFHQLDEEAFVLALTRWFASYGISLAPELKEAHASVEHLPGASLLSAVAHQLRAVLAEEGAGSATPTHQVMAKLPMLLLAGQTITADALLAQRELAQQILHAIQC
jgi:DNA-binding GntR family transcriptional regulator